VTVGRKMVRSATSARTIANVLSQQDLRFDLGSRLRFEAEAMILKAEKILREASGPAVGSADGKGPINGSLLRLARLIGKQIAREHFEKDASKKTRRRLTREAKRTKEST
jgi:hypothetical protein